jgi:hypothetical protein
MAMERGDDLPGPTHLGKSSRKQKGMPRNQSHGALKTRALLPVKSALTTTMFLLTRRDSKSLKRLENMNDRLDIDYNLRQG